MHLSILGIHLDVNVAHTGGALQFSQFKIIPEQPFGLPHDGPNDVLALDGSVYFDISPNFILHGLAFSTASAV